MTIFPSLIYSSSFSPFACSAHLAECNFLSLFFLIKKNIDCDILDQTILQLGRSPDSCCFGLRLNPACAVVILGLVIGFSTQREVSWDFMPLVCPDLPSSLHWWHTFYHHCCHVLSNWFTGQKLEDLLSRLTKHMSGMKLQPALLIIYTWIALTWTLSIQLTEVIKAEQL